MKTTRLVVNHKEKKLPLLDFLAARLDVSRRAAKRLLDAHAIFVNRRRVWMAHHTLAERDVVEVENAAGASPARESAPGPAPATPAPLPPALYEDDAYLIVDKPPGMLSDGAGSVEARLRNAGRPGLRAVHRLDRDTSGCLWLAVDEAARRQAVELFRAGNVKKTYRAVVAGRLASDMQRITAPLEGRRAVTEFRVLDANASASHLALRIETGRTHQIRKHLAAGGHPVMGDREYWGRRLQTPQTMRVARQMLHALRLEFAHPVTGARVAVTAPPPRDFKACLALFRLT